MSHQGVHGRRLDGHIDGVEIGSLDVLHSLHVNVQNANLIFGLNSLHSCFTVNGAKMRLVMITYIFLHA